MSLALSSTMTPNHGRSRGAQKVAFYMVISHPTQGRCHFVRLVDYVCINPLHDENETHERTFLRTDMGRCRHVQSDLKRI